MADYRDMALAAYNGRKTAWIKRGRDRLVPLMTDSAAKLVLDPYTKTVVAHEDLAEGLLILTTTDGSNVSFAVYPDAPSQPVATVYKADDGAWTRGVEVADLDDVGEAIAKGAV